MFEKVRGKLMNQFTEKTQHMRKSKMSKDAAETNISVLSSFLPELESKFRVDIQNALNNVLKNQAQEAVEEYKKYLAELIGSVSYEIPPAAILGDTATISVASTLDEYSHTEDVKVGSHQEVNKNKKWYKPWTWLQDKYVTVDDYEEQEFINFEEYLEEKILPTIQDSVEYTREAAFSWAKEEEKQFKEFFKKQLEKLDEAIARKLSEQKKSLESKESFEKMIEENERNLSWIDNFKKELDSLLAV